MSLALSASAQEPETGAAAAPAAAFGEVVRVAVSMDYPPYEYVLEDGTIEGFNVDAMRAVARTMGFTLELRPMLWSEALDALRAGEIDALAGMLRSNTRDEWVDFATPLISIEYSIFVKRGTRGLMSVEDLRGRSVLVERDALMHEFMIDSGMAEGVVAVASEPEALRMLDAGDHAAALVGYQQGLQIAREFGLHDVEPSGPPVFSTGFGFAVIEGNTALLDRYDRGLADIRRTGEFQEIYNHYFGVEGDAGGAAGALPMALVAVAAVVVAAGVVVLLVFGWRRIKRSGASGDGARLGGYELVDQVGAGGMGEVWRARHLALSRPAAIKLIRLESLQGGGETASSAKIRFEREARATAALRSSHTIEIYDYGQTEDGSVYYAMELLSGLDLQRLVDRFGPLPPERAIALLRQVCDSLSEAHDAGLLHRDIKPANIFACHLGSAYDAVKVLDFGLVKLRGAEGPDAVDLTRADAITGTPKCLPPEAVRGEVELDARADLYSLGCVAYFLLTGKDVFESDTPMTMAVAHVTEAPTAPSERLGAPVPDDLEQIVMSLLAKDPADRPASAVELDRQLAACRGADGWTAEHARTWWEENAPEVGESSAELLSSALSSSRAG